MHRNKIEAALTIAINHLEDSLRTLPNTNDEKALSDSLWSTSAETEYAVFLLSLTQGDRSESASWKHGSSSKQITELKPALASALELLRSAKSRVEAGNMEKGYQEAWTARSLLLKTQELLEKRRTEAKK